MSPPNFHFIKYLKQLLLATSLVALTACGGGGGDDDDDDTPPVATNKNPTVSISSDSRVTEGGELVLQATATDSDGEIASYAWQQTSGPELTLSGSDTSKLTITAPEIEEDAIVVVSLIVTDDDAATATAKVSIELKRKVLSLKITGIVTDEPIINSSVAVQIGDQQFEVTADAEGRYSVNIEVDDSDADELVKLVALGNNAIDPDVEFISQLKSIATLISQAGSDGTLSKDENFGVNITNVSTAEFALLSRNGADIDSEQALDKALLAVDADEKLLLAAIIKIIVDDPNFSLPEGINSTLQLVTSQQETANFVNNVNYSNAKLIEDTKTAIKRDTDLVDNSFSSVVGSHLIVSPKYYTKHSASQIEFYTDGTGRYIDTSFDVVFSWTQQDGVVNTILSEPKKGSCYLESNGDTQQRMCRYITDSENANSFRK
ncbi:PKD domain-containing protein [Pseudoalteromonas gelatinilytica]